MNTYLDFEKPISELETKLEELRKLSEDGKLDFSEEISILETKVQKMIKTIFANLTPWEKVLLARHPQRPHMLDYIDMIFKDFIELHGDRNLNDDQSMVCGFATLNDPDNPIKVLVVGQQKGRNTKEKLLK